MPLFEMAAFGQIGQGGPRPASGRLFAMVARRKPDIYRKAGFPGMITSTHCSQRGFTEVVVRSHGSQANPQCALCALSPCGEFESESDWISEA